MDILYVLKEVVNAGFKEDREVVFIPYRYPDRILSVGEGEVEGSSLSMVQ